MQLNSCINSIFHTKYIWFLQKKKKKKKKKYFFLLKKKKKKKKKKNCLGALSKIAY